MFNLKILLRNAAKILNYEIKKLPPNRNINVYLDQQALLGNQKVDIIFDVGANIGSTTREYLRLFPHSSIYCFEPFKEPFLILLESFKNFNSVKPFKLAVTDLVGKKPFFVNKANVTNSLLPPACEYEKYQSPDMMSTLNTISVETTTIDYFCNKQFIDNIQAQWYLAVKALVLAMIVSTLEGISAALVMPFIQILQNGGTSANFQFPYLLQVLTNFYTKLPEQWQLIAVIFSFFCLTVVKNISQYFSSFNINDLQLKVGLAIRQECIERFLELELPFYSKSNLGELLSYVNEQAQRSEALSSYILEIGRDLLIISVLLGLLISLSPALTIITLISLGIVILILQNLIKLVRSHGHKSAKFIEIFSSIITEIISGIRLVKSFNTEARELHRTKQSLQNRYEAELAAYSITQWFLH
jgi:FkbM family methyltransferase